MIEVKIDKDNLIIEVYSNGQIYSRITGGPEDGPMVVEIKDEDKRDTDG